MTTPSLQDGIDQAGSPVKLLWKPNAQPFKVPVVPPEFAGWREEQEAKLCDKGQGGMTRPEIARFVAYYERLTRWILAEMPARADWVVTLDTERNPYA